MHGAPRQQGRFSRDEIRRADIGKSSVKARQIPSNESVATTVNWLPVDVLSPGTHCTRMTRTSVQPHVVKTYVAPNVCAYIHVEI